jgi:hypothetical protein
LRFGDLGPLRGAFAARKGPPPKKIARHVNVRVTRNRYQVELMMLSDVEGRELAPFDSIVLTPSKHAGF